MKISDTVRSLIAITGHKQQDVLPAVNTATPQALNNKIRLDRWDGKDLVLIADLLGCRLCFQLPTGDMIYFDPSEYKETPAEESARAFLFGWLKNVPGLLPCG